MSEAASTVYDVRTRYSIDDKAGEGLSSLEAKADRAGHSMLSLKSIAATVGAAFGFHEAKKAFIDFNAEMESLKITMGAVIQANLGGTFEEARQSASGLFKEFQAFAVKSPLTTREVADFGNNIAAGTFAAGAGIQQFTNFAEQGALAARTLGANADYAGMEMQEMIMGAVSNRMRFAKQLLSFSSFKGDYKEFNALDQKARLEVISSALNSPAMKSAGEAFAQSFSGVTSTLKDNIEITLGQVGLPLFKEITKEIRRWDDWILANPDKIESFAKEFAADLVKGFHVVQAVGTWVVDNRETLLHVAEAFLVFKGAGAIAGGLGGVVKGLSDFSLQVTKAGGGVGGLSAALGDVAGEKGLGKLIGQLGIAAGALGALYFAAQAFADWVDKKQDEDIEKGTTASVIKDAAKRAEKSRLTESLDDRDQMAMLGHAKDLGAIKRDAAQRLVLDKDKLRSELGSLGIKPEVIQSARGGSRLGPDPRDKIIAETEKALELANTSAKAFHESQAYLGLLKPLADQLYGPSEQKDRVPAGENTKINININKIEVASEDPDRFAFGAVKAFERAVKSPTQAEAAIRGGF